MSARAFVGLLLAGCVSSASPSGAPEVPPSDRDPLPYTPPPAAEGRAGETVALAATGGEDQARRMLPALLVAVRDADVRGLSRLFAAEVVRLQRQDSARPREAVVGRLLLYARRTIIQPETEPDALVDLGGVRASRAAQHFEGRALPAGVRGTDIVLEIPVRGEGRGALGAMFQWHARGAMIVRPGRDPRIVAF